MWHKLLQNDRPTTLQAGDRLLLNLDSGAFKLSRGATDLSFQSAEAGHPDNCLYFGPGLSPAMVHTLIVIMCMLSGLRAEPVEGGTRIYLFEFQEPRKEN